MRSPTHRRWLPRVALALGAAVLLGGTWTLYARPEFLVLLADQVWLCF